MIRSVPRHDFRSDTITEPTDEMRRAMAEAVTGDDVFRDDPTVIALEEEVAGRFGREASLFVPSGVMGNLISVVVHTSPGDELLLEENSHTFHFETGGASAVAGVQTQTFRSDRGVPDLAALTGAIRAVDIHLPRTALAIYENTNNISGGVVVPLPVMRAVRELSREHGFAVHLDGARVWNAHVASGHSLAEIAGEVDSVMCCLSKGLSAPVGSMLIGDRAFIEEARRVRKRLGGGMRQVGVLAAAGRVALRGIDRLADDHARAKRLATGIADLPGIEIDPSLIETNIVIFRLAGDTPRYEELVAHLAGEGIGVISLWGRGIRFVTHRMVGDDAVDAALAAMRGAVSAGILG
jgi:threonine aldolase